jgi:hypothetical protein
MIINMKLMKFTMLFVENKIYPMKQLNLLNYNIVNYKTDFYLNKRLIKILENYLYIDLDIFFDTTLTNSINDEINLIEVKFFML